MSALPQIIMLALMAIGVLGAILLHGQPKKSSSWNGWESFALNCITFALLKWGGFFAVWGW